MECTFSSAINSIGRGEIVYVCERLEIMLFQKVLVAHPEFMCYIHKISYG